MTSWLASRPRRTSLLLQSGLELVPAAQRTDNHVGIAGYVCGKSRGVEKRGNMKPTCVAASTHNGHLSLRLGSQAGSMAATVTLTKYGGMTDIKHHTEGGSTNQEKAL